MIISMTHLEIVGLRKELHDTIKNLQALGVTHINETNPHEAKGGKFLKAVKVEDEKSEERRKLESMENTVKEIMPLVQNSTGVAASKEDFLNDPARFEIILNQLKQHRGRLIGLTKEKNDAAGALEMAGKYREILKILPDVLRGSQSTSAVDYFAISIDKNALSELKHALAHEIDGTVSIRTAKWKGTQLLGVVSFPATQAEDVKDAAWKHGATEIVLPSEFRGTPVKDSLTEIEKRLEHLPKKMAELEVDTCKYVKEHGAQILRVHQEVEDSLDRFRTLTHAAESKYLFVLSVWTPTENVKNVISTLKDRFKDALSINELEAKSWEHEEIPVTLKNPGFLKPFELLLSFFPPPVYGTMDATLFLFLFPVFFGLILGDIGYGLVMALLLFWTRSKAKANEPLKAITAVGLWCAGWSIFFGLVFGEVFGSLGHTVFHIKPLWNDRLLITTEYLILSIFIGIFHIYLGLFLGLYLGIKHGHPKHAFEKFGFILFLTGGLTALVSQMATPGTVIGSIITTPPSILLKTGLSMIGASVLILGWAAGVAGLIEIFSIISNVLSYARIMAIGVASVALAEVANDFGGAGGFAAILIAVLVHSINLVLGMFDPTIQALRLHYVEFFTKFYQSGGKAFQPLQKHV